MATKIRPIVFKIDEPEGFVMNASNATISNNTANWEGPNYPDGYDGVGKTLQIIVKEEGFTCYSLQFQYANSVSGQGPGLIDGNNGAWVNPNDNGYGTASIPVGTYNVSIIQNIAGSASGYGKYITVRRNGPDGSLDSALLSKLEFRIID
jgi:hypothetical protein